MNYKSFFVRRSPTRKEDLMERFKDMSDIVAAVDFITSWKSINQMKLKWIPRDGTQKLSGLNSGPRFCHDVVFGQSPHSARGRQKEKPGLSPSNKVPPSISLRCHDAGNHQARKFLPFCPQFIREQVPHPSKIVGRQSELVLQMMKNCSAIHAKDVDHRLRGRQLATIFRK
jgi:hypothetical protein